MRSLFSLLLSAIALTSFCQTAEENQVDSKGRKQGCWKKVDENNYVVYRGCFKDDQPQGTFRYYYPYKDTLIKAVMTFKNGGKESYATLYHVTGMLMGKGKYVNQLKDSVWNYFDEQGKLISTDVYVKDKKNGVCKTYYQNGKLYSETSYKNGMKDGVWKEFFEDGKTKAEGGYLKDKMEGKTTYYYPNAKVAAQGLYKGGLKHMTWVYYKADGKLESKDVHNNGTLLEGKAAEEFLKNSAAGKPQGEKTPVKGKTGTSTKTTTTTKTPASTKSGTTKKP
jgi:antitoxin component YwqK of YwqJK toxin-antitoxin module